MKLFRGLVILTLTVASAAIFSGCHGSSRAIPSTILSGASKSHSAASSAAVPDMFSKARGLVLADGDLDKYISPGLPSADRALAHRLMKQMPPLQRGDFVYLSRSGHLVSNNAALLREIVVTQSSTHSVASGHVATGLPVGSVHPHSSLRPLYDAPCTGNPPNPPPTPDGAYVREVSQCGFTGGLAFVNVPCGYSNFNSGDAGYLYFELVGRSQSLTEGGVQYNSDSSLQPYMRSTAYGYLTTTMNDYNQHYTCGQDIVMAAGATSDGTDTYVEIGLVPSSCDPEQNFCEQQEFTPSQVAWLFYAAPGDYTGSGVDGAGFNTPCTSCTIARVTAIGQSGVATYSEDGSYFGTLPGGLGSHINWMQVTFGDWGTDCHDGTTLCTINSSSYPPAYYGGQQVYPTYSAASATTSNQSGYGPYESYDAIDLIPGDSLASSAPGSFSEPLPPPLCASDSEGYCALHTSAHGSASCGYHLKQINGRWYEIPAYYSTNVMYAVYNGSVQRNIVDDQVTESGTSCIRSDVWTPGEPRVMYGDANLP